MPYLVVSGVHYGDHGEDRSPNLVVVGLSEHAHNVHSHVTHQVLQAGHTEPLVKGLHHPEGAQLPDDQRQRSPPCLTPVSTSHSRTEKQPRPRVKKETDEKTRRSPLFFA